MKSSGLIAIALALSTAAPAAAGVKLGDKAPPVGAGVWYNLPKGVDVLAASHLAGRIVMVEFWATW